MLPDILVDALVQVAAEKQREWAKDLERRDAEHKAIIAVFEKRVLEYEATLRSMFDDKLAALEAKVLKLRGPQGEPGAVGAKGEQGFKGDAGDAGPVGPPGPQGERGEKGDQGDVGAQGEQGIQGEKGVPGDPGDPGKNGEDGLMGEPGPRGEKGEPGAMGLSGKDGADGVGLASLMIDRDGCLVGTLSDGKAIQLGKVVGKDGSSGENGKDGKDGRDGFGFEDLMFEYDGVRGFSIIFTKGDEAKQFNFNLPIPIDAGPHRSSSKYTKGDCVTHDGCYWIAQVESPQTKPGTSPEWRMVSRKGRDGKDGKNGQKGDRGPEGKAGRDLTQLGSDGSKWR